MSEYEIKPLDASTWDAFARLVEKHNGCGFGGCWCTWSGPRRATVRSVDRSPSAPRAARANVRQYFGPAPAR